MNTKKIILFIIFCGFISCSNNDVTITKDEYTKLKGENYPRTLGEFDTKSAFRTTISVIAIDSCEYIGLIYGSDSDKIAHKGNCIFCKQRRDKENEYIINEIVKRLKEK